MVDVPLMRYGFPLYSAMLLLSLLIFVAQRLFAAAKRAKKKLDRAALLDELAEKEAVQAARPGGSPANPFVVDSSAVIDSRAKRQPCPLCGGRLHFDEQVVERYQGKLLRCTLLTCIDCRIKRRFWFDIVAAA